MISNPGQSVSPTVMQTSVYDTTNKKQDIFQYTDSKVSDKVTSAQVASQISSVTSNFVTSSQVSTMIANDRSSNPYLWRRVVFISLQNYNQPVKLQSLYNNTDYRSSYIAALPLSINLNNYVYEFAFVVNNLTTNVNSDTTFSLDCDLGNSSTSTRNSDTVASAVQTVTSKTTGTPNSWLQKQRLFGYLVKNNSLFYKEGLTAQTASPYCTTMDSKYQYSLQGARPLNSTTYTYVGFETSGDDSGKMYGKGIWFEYRAIMPA